MQTLFRCPYIPCAIARISVYAHVKDPVVHLRVRLIMMMAHSSQTRILGKVDGQFLHTLMHFGQTMVWDEDDRDAARSFCLLCFSFAAFCLSASNLQLAFLTDERQLSRSEASCCHD